MGSNTLLVAGKESRSQETRIERWTLAPPILGMEIGPGGVITPGLHLQPVTEKIVIYDEATVGRDMVAFILDLQGASTEALVHFGDSGDIYRLDWATAPYALTRLATSTAPSSGEFGEPALAGVFDTAMRGDHLTMGYVHWFAHHESFGANPIVAFFDGDRDGTIDSVSSWTTSDWSGGPFGLAANWSNVGGRPQL